jgi:ribosome-associated toxin RatA of RatAB toxin-antitoxin module
MADSLFFTTVSARLVLSLFAIALLSYVPVVQTLASSGSERSSEFTWWTEKQQNGHRWVKAKLLIQASTEIVWQAIHNEQNGDADLVYRKVLSHGLNDVVSEQKLAHLPIIGTAVSTMHTTEVPLKRIDYSMVKSDRFKALEGSWVLTPASNKSTYLELSSYCDIGIPIPRPIREGITVKKLEKRLANVKHNSELAQFQIAAEKTQAERLD